MKRLTAKLTSIAIITALASHAPVQAKDDVELVTCEESLGTIAIVDGDTQGWAEFGLGSPRPIINSLAVDSGCFTPHSPASSEPADFLMNVIAGSSEEVDQSIEIAKTAAVEGLVRSGAATSVMSRVPGAGAVMGMFNMFGGKKKRVAAGIKLLSPSTGLAVVTGSGTVKKSTLSFRGASPWGAIGNQAGYSDSRQGKQLVEAFVLAFNQVVAQEAAIRATPRPSASAPASDVATVNVATSMLAMPMDSAETVRGLEPGTTLNPTGKREGLFVEVEDNFGTKGWVSVEALN
ncbi:SH3 domain-containing protein [Erythrobacter sp. SCSIO 43205]|uniref:SH3 domain-containing protein n=1 Tax=Erythrobacter sp. SCSIO 43205 TaxID=2779361 RepID=UPI001CA8A66E|nr:SH3 domain-containing protein [Erythrobacter sp. SCSIO 43205]UAB78387.1 SH3 domain-containing protein [Erythrobacter sp. SCSIO 43205]